MLPAKRWMWNGFKRETVFVKIGSNTVDVSLLAHKQQWAGNGQGGGPPRWVTNGTAKLYEPPDEIHFKAYSNHLWSIPA